MYITVTVGNRIHQIKSSIYLSGSGDSGEERGGGLWEGWPRGERVTLTWQGCEGEGRGWSGPTGPLSWGQTRNFVNFTSFWSHLSLGNLFLMCHQNR